MWRSFQEIRMGKNVFQRIFSAFVKSIHVQLPDKAMNISMSEILGKDGVFKKFNILDRELFAIFCPFNNMREIGILSFN